MGASIFDSEFRELGELRQWAFEEIAHRNDNPTELNWKRLSSGLAIFFIALLWDVNSVGASIFDSEFRELGELRKWPFEEISHRNDNPTKLNRKRLSAGLAILLMHFCGMSILWEQAFLTAKCASHWIVKSPASNDVAA